ncbi:MAG: efflux RND transporter periplasmic adaptor subunit, partial [Verrucomicrobia bacterium]|nr:efflux RND transporter periplasmic adaptor subunit [Verrucomicrobiota bacterium]
MKKWIVWILVLGVLGFLGYGPWKAWRAKAREADGNKRPSTASVIQTNISFAVNAAGEISPAEQVSVRPEINGKIEVLPVDIGDQVEKDSLLFKLDDKELQQQRASNLTAIERARLELAKAERDYKRADEMLADHLISQELHDNTQTTFELAKNSLERAQKELAIIEERLTKTEVRAPFDCTVLTRPVSIGQAVSGSGGFNSGTEVLSIADLNSMVINAHVNQADVPRLGVSQTVEVSVEAVPGLLVTGVVERIAPQATIRNNIKGFAARILLKNVDRRVRPGMTANVKIPVASVENVLAVPLAAVFTELNPETGQMERFAYVQNPTGYERRPVRIGVSDFFYAEVQDGLAPGETVSLELPKEQRDKPSKNLAGAPFAPGRVAAAARATGAP